MEQSKLKLNIKDIEAAQNNCKEINFFDYVKDLDLEEKVSATLIASNSGFDHINVSGEIKAKVNLTCDRCLETYVQELETSINEEYSEGKYSSEAENKECELKDGDFVVELNGQQEIDIEDLIYQSIVLEIPNKRLCKAECSGVEGHQEESEENNEEIIDERLEVFKRFSENNFYEK